MKFRSPKICQIAGCTQLTESVPHFTEKSEINFDIQFQLQMRLIVVKLYPFMLIESVHYPF